MRGRFLLALLFLAACSGDDLLPAYDLSGSTMGTTFQVTLVAPPAELDLVELEAAIHERLDLINSVASTYLDDSDLSAFNANPSTDWIRTSPDLCQMIGAALEISQATGGVFDITVGPLVNLWGFGPASPEQALPTADEVSNALAKVGYTKLETDCDHTLVRKTSADIYVDLSGWAKGHAVDQVAALLDSRGLEDYLVEIGGELRLKGHNRERKAFAVAIEKPLPDGTMSHTIVRLSNAAVATSGDYRNFFLADGQRYSHAIDPRTGFPVNHDLTGVTVVDRNTAFADAMATALLVLGPEDGLELAEKLRVAAYFLVRDGNSTKELTTTQFDQLRHM